ncbi:MAG: DNA recombination protein RmuC, partial [Oscillospiraceae bacterium]|nr:DNA recombination protein RmuC [Oscillospiraceae bacterium]
MTLTDYLAAFAAALSAVSAVLCCILLSRQANNKRAESRMDEMRREVADELRASRTEQAQSLQGMSGAVVQSLQGSFSRQDAQLETLQKSVSDRLAAMDKRLGDSALQSELKMENMRATVEKQLAAMRADNDRKLDAMRATVDEKLQKTLEDRIGQSFKLVSERLEQVSRGLGEMQTLATGVGDLKKVLSNVKTRGIFGELQLAAILEQILSPEQYAANIVTKPGSRDAVEFAVKFPGEDGETVYLPIDSKFPMDVYQGVMDAYDSADPV